MEEIRLLSKDDIEVRVAQTSASQQGVKVSLLLYKNARVDMKILDELYTPMGWKRTHKLIGDRLYCQVEVWDDQKKEWICKEDVGVESNTEAEKGQASDSFKRACVNWGIGRELYTAPRISVDLGEREYSKDQSGRVRVWASFQVSEIGYDKKTRTITSLVITDRFGNVRFQMGEQAQAKPKTSKKQVAYQPMESSAYWKIIKFFAEGTPAKSGQDYRSAWIEATHAGENEILKFDNDVDNYRAANQI